MIELVRWKREFDIEFFYSSNCEELYYNMSDTFPKNFEQCRKLVSEFSDSDDRNEYIRAIQIDGKVIGCIGAFFDKDMYCKNAEIAYWISKEFWGKGIMTEIIKIFTDNIFSLYDIHRVYARPLERNIASRKVLEKVGYTYEGTMKDSVYKQGKMLNAVLYAIIKE